MRKFWRRLGTINQVSLAIVAIVFVAGMVLAIVVAPVAGAINAAFAIALTSFCFWFFLLEEVRGNRLRYRGVKARATILAVDDAGVTVQDDYPLARLRLSVRPKTGEPHETTTANRHRRARDGSASSPPP